MLIAALCIFLVFLCACVNTNEYYELNLETNNISLTMQNYLNDESPNYIGNAFQIKPKSVYAVTFDGDPSRTYYRYRLLIAPITNEPIEIESINIQPAEKRIRDYLNSSTTKVGLGDLDEWNSVTKEMMYFKFSETEEFTAYFLEITFNNLGDATLLDSGLTSEDLEKGIRNIEVIIEYNGKEDLIIPDEIDLQRIKSADDSVLSTRDDLLDLYENGSTYSGLEPYR